VKIWGTPCGGKQFHTTPTQKITYIHYFFIPKKDLARLAEPRRQTIFWCDGVIVTERMISTHQSRVESEEIE
jgi:hypothetical protein